MTAIFLLIASGASIKKILADTPEFLPQLIGIFSRKGVNLFPLLLKFFNFFPSLVPIIPCEPVPSISDQRFSL